MQGRVGWTISQLRTAGVFGKMISQARIGWAHEFMPEADVVSASLATSPFLLIQNGQGIRGADFGASRDGAHVGQDWLEMGAGIQFDLNCGANLRLDYEGQFGRNNATAHFGTIKMGFQF